MNIQLHCKHCSRWLWCLFLFQFLQESCKVDILLSPLLRLRNWWPENFVNLPKVIQLVGGSSRNQIQMPLTARPLLWAAALGGEVGAWGSSLHSRRNWGGVQTKGSFSQGRSAQRPKKWNQIFRLCGGFSSVMAQHPAAYVPRCQHTASLEHWWDRVELPSRRWCKLTVWKCFRSALTRISALKWG